MAYEFPPRNTLAASIANPEHLNETLTMLADTANLLDGHNIDSASFSANVIPDIKAFGKHYAVHVGSNPAFKTGSPSYQVADATAANVFTLEAHGRWQEVTGCTITTDTTGVVLLKIEAFAQYIWHGWKGSSLVTSYDHIAHGVGSANGIRSIPANIQFALKVDGVVVDESITGHTKLNRDDFIPVKAKPERVQTAVIGMSPTQPGPLQPKTQRIAGLGPQCSPVVVQASMQAEPGTHTITLVVRRLLVGDTGQRVDPSEDDTVTLYNRTMIVYEAPLLPKITYSSTGVSVPAFETEDVLSNTSMYSNRINPIRLQLNDIPTSAIRPYSLRYAHLPSILLSTSRFETGVSPSVVTTNNWFDGESGAIAGAINGTTGWTLLHDGAGGNFATSITTDVTSRASFVRIRGHVQISYIIDDLGTYARATGFHVAVALGYRMNGTWNIITRSICYLNSWNVITDGVNVSAEETSVPLMAYLDYRSSLPSYNISSFGIFAAVFSNADYSGAWARVKVGWRQAGLFVLQHRN